MITINVKQHPENSTFSFQVNPNITFTQLKQLVYERYQIPVQIQFYLFKGRRPIDSQTLLEIGVQNGDFLHLVKRSESPLPASSDSDEDSEIQSNNSVFFRNCNSLFTLILSVY